jgi:DNA-binding YbaB/EbfC family protein
MKAELGNLMQQAQQMQNKLKKAQEELAKTEIQGQSGGGLVSIIMNGRHEVCRVSLDDSLMEDDKEMIEDLVAAAMNDAVHKLEDQTSEHMSQVASGMQLPEGLKFPF